MPGEIYRYEDPDPKAWKRFIAEKNSGRPFECDQEMFDYWVGVLRPVWMNYTRDIPGVGERLCTFGFAEGMEPITAFWQEGERFFGCRLLKEIAPL